MKHSLFKGILSRSAATRGAVYFASALVLMASSAPSLAALTDLASSPLTTSSTTVVKPNILFTLDDSGSMDREYMPDSYGSNTGDVGFRNHLCNVIYYNPAITYTPPKNPDGTDFANASFTGAKADGFVTGSTTPINLSTSFRAHNSDTAQLAYYYRFTGTGTPTSSQCSQSANSGFPHSTTDFTKVLVSSTSGPGATDERQNFANWYSYYRTRMLMMRSATGRAFSAITDSYRVGFITINPGSPVTSAKYLPISDFNATQKAAWYEKLYGQNGNSSTPLREALSRAGRHFAGLQNGINNGMSGDPVQYSCQQNFTFLTTDGYWNGNAGDKLDGTAIGNHDGVLNATAPRPIFDGSSSVTTVSTNVDTESYSTNGCRGSRTKIVRVRNTTAVTTDNTTGVTTTTTSSSSSTVEGCRNNQRALQSPNPQTNTLTATASTGGSSGSLADVAQYYYITDLRPNGSLGALGTDVGTGTVPSSGSGPEDDTATHQHMTTFTMGLGLNGTLNYSPNYQSGAGDFAALRSGALNWPTAVQGDPTALDDLWHAAVNGRGQFFSASNPNAVVSGLQAALAGVNARTSSAAAAATSNLEVVSGDNFAYTASYTTKEWTGDIKAREVDLNTGAVSAASAWSAQVKLDAQTKQFCDSRSIKLFRGGAANNLVNFTWNSSTCDGSGNPTGTPSTGLNAAEQAEFNAGKVALLSQFPSMTDGTLATVNQRAQAAGAKMVNYLRGQRGYENFLPNDTDSLFRTRTHVMGDIINAQPVFVRVPGFDYLDTGYSAFKTAQASRTSMLYAAANDGMLHAFRAGTPLTPTGPPDPLGGEELWAFVPTMSLPNLYKLADTNYANTHQFFVDGTPSVGDVYDPLTSAWKTILVGGLNHGGKGYYALDITDPANPKGLWEFKHNASTCSGAGAFSDCHLGFTYGTPTISKLADGRWAVFVTSGINNVNSPAIAGDGVGYLYVLNAVTGEIIYKISTGYGTIASPSGLNQINNFVDDANKNNTTQRLYGVDLQGNIWRFSVNGTQSATLLAVAKDALGARQPIMIKPRLANVGSPPAPTVFVATGRYLGTTDLGNTQGQTVYSIKDTLSATPIADLRAANFLRQIAIANTTTSRTATCASGCSSTDGWYADLPDSGERVNVDIKLQLGTLAVASNVPTSTPCSPGGYSYINFFSATSGLAVATTNNLSEKFDSNPVVGLSIVRLPDGRVILIVTLGGDSGGGSTVPPTKEVPISAGPPTGKRISWRELLQ